MHRHDMSNPASISLASRFDWSGPSLAPKQCQAATGLDPSRHIKDCRERSVHSLVRHVEGISTQGSMTLYSVYRLWNARYDSSGPSPIIPSLLDCILVPSSLLRRIARSGGAVLGCF